MNSTYMKYKDVEEALYDRRYCPHFSAEIVLNLRGGCLVSVCLQTASVSRRNPSVHETLSLINLSN